jgi:hypothetical protein
MSNFLDWRNYTAQPHIKKLIESKGIEAARVQFIKDSNKTMWDDPFIINESYESPGTSLSNNASAAAGSNPFLYGNTAETQSIAWVSTITNGITGSGAGLHEYYFDVTAYNGTVDYSFGHTDSFKTFRFLVVSSSGEYTYSNTTGLAGLVTASYTKSETVNITGSLLHKFKDAIANQSSTAVIAGFTNTIAPNTLFTSTLAAASGSLTITHVNEGGVPSLRTTFASTTASVSVTTQGTDKLYDGNDLNNSNNIIVDGALDPYNSLIRKG